MEVAIINTTKALASYIKEKGISIKAIARETGISEGVLYCSLGRGRDRELRADEFLKICIFVDVDPMMFVASINKNEKLA